MILYERPVRFEDVDAAGIVFFARFLNYCHEAMERLFDGADGAYVGLIMGRRVGFPAVHVAADFKAPLRYGDVVRIAVSVAKVGTTSCELRYRLTRAADDTPVAEIAHVCVATNLATMEKLPLPVDVRALLDAHREA